MELFMLSDRPVESVSQIAKRLRGEVLSGRLEPGLRMPEVPLAERFGVSRARIREAFRQLVHEGLLANKPNCGVVVTQEPEPRVRQTLLPIRAEMETRALRFCFDDLDESDFDAWDTLLSHLRLACEKQDYSTMITLDYDFHRGILVRAGLEEIVPIWTLVVGRLRGMHERRERSLPDPLEVHAMHVALVEVFRRGDKEASVQALRDHALEVVSMKEHVGSFATERAVSVENRSMN